MNIKNYVRGWFLGKFYPSLAQTDYEVGLRWNETGDTDKRHYHKEVTEYVVFAGGKHRLNDQIFNDGDMTTIYPYMSTDYECLEPGYCLTVKDQSIPDDKYLGTVPTLIIPMAGKGQRFKDAGFTTPKPLIPIEGMPMIYRVADNFKPNGTHRTLFITRKDFNHLLPGHVIRLDHETEGAVSTILEAEQLIGREDPLIIANCDQLILEFDVDDFMNKSADCSVTVFESTVPHHSYIKETNGLVTEVAEKKVISNKAVSGIYFYRKSKYFFDNAKRMIKKNIRVNGEFYNTPVFNEIIAQGLTVNTYEVSTEKQQILGTPQELQVFEDKLAKGEIKL
jgi:dTDP-glucose pyrophosphorylase